MSAPDPTAGERRVHKPGCGIEFTWAPGDCTCPATPDADDASEPLTEAEVDTLADAFVAANRAEFMDTDFDLPIQQAVERIKAAAATKARADELTAAAKALRKADTDGLLFLDGPPFERVPWESVARWLDDRVARIVRGDA